MTCVIEDTLHECCCGQKVSWFKSKQKYL